MSDISDCLYQIRQGISDSAFGYKIQAIASHILLRLGFSIKAINNTGHPDIVACLSGDEYYFEVEAEVVFPSLRKLTDTDLTILTTSPGVKGYYALAVGLPLPRWILVPAEKLTYRSRKSPKSLLQALSDKQFSTEWTQEYQYILEHSFTQVKYSSYSNLCSKALEGTKI